MSEQEQSNSQSQPWSDPWQQQQAQPSSQAYNGQAYPAATDPNYAYYQQYPDQYYNYYQQYQQPPSSAAAASVPQQQHAGYQYDYNYAYSQYPATAAYGAYDYSQYGAASSAAAPAPGTSHYAYDHYYYGASPTSSSSQQPNTGTSYQRPPPPPPPPSKAAASSSYKQQKKASQQTQQQQPPSGPPSYIAVPPTGGKKAKATNESTDTSTAATTASPSTTAPPATVPSPTPSHASSSATSTANNNASKPPSVDSWPPALQEYVEEVFNNCLPDKRDQAEKQLRSIIMEKHKQGTLMTTDWRNMDLPLACGSARFRKQSKPKKFKGYQDQHDNQSVPSVDPPLTREEEERRRSRFLRFQGTLATPRRASPGADDTAVRNMDHTIVGTCQTLEKNYLRLTSAPDPATVRPLPILRQTLELLKNKWRKEQNYTYICDQFKSMRQDLTVQRIQNEFTVKVYEIHARIALEKGDLGEYNQCQTQLKSLYKKGIEGNENEFTAYRILYFLHTRNWSDINSEMAGISIESKEDPNVRHALQVRSSIATNNYHRFFHLYIHAPNMGGYLMDQFVERERAQALMILCKAFRPSLKLSFIAKELAFDNLEQLEKFLKEHKAWHVTGKGEDVALDTKTASANLAESAKRYKKIDIKGQM
ncbi:hypothetical protein O0I10_006937 [Lichtheimia ornata]|uniref:PCI domain-containing protein n=1 Tax=Lichtheimia ornata TaxID=688661 RepID=A0AAD7Y0M7_9FUNG|nr:uncharacterized protein O0I10_006937 [Lichtheimia ornata]KAJ8657382.1 hypothetical protein O0I10_006937 [Lichtheimia ornata]